MNLNKSKKYLYSPIIEKYRGEFNDEIIKIGVHRAKRLAIILIFFEIMMLIVSFVLEKERFFNTPRIYYGIMYVVMIMISTVYFILFSKIEKHKINKIKTVKGIFYTCTSFVLLWSAGISLLDQISYGQVTAYFTAIIGVALITLYEPIASLIIYISIHIVFIICLPFFQKSNTILFGNYMNTSIFLILSWVIQTFIYKSRIDDFNNKKIIQEKSVEMNELYEKLKLANEELELLAQMDGLTADILA